ncbi:aldo/keto reductase [Spirochaetia bacterium]|nr:aldo/keto reductase [Spirochaetia bacterium]
MQYRKDIKSGNDLSVLGFGCMRFPRTLGSIDMKKTEQLIQSAVEGGVNYFDTAYIYPGSEEALGTILDKNGLREKVYIATKMPIILTKGPDDFDKYFNKQLERLRTGYIDYYLMHMLTDTASWERLHAWGIEDWIAGKKKSGLIRQAGFSFHGSQGEFLKLVDVYDWDFCQIQYNYSDENYQAGVKGLKKAAEKMPVMIMEPLLGGKLTVDLPRQAAEIWKKADAEVTPAARGLNWIWDQKEAVVVLSGMGEKNQLEENIRLADKAAPGMLNEEDRELYCRVREIMNRSFKIHCAGCNYCMPCPQKVNIPGCFAAYNTSFSLGWIQGMQQYATSTGITSVEPSGPSRCVKCGKCEAHCPQHIPIIQSLKMVRSRMEPLPVRCGLAIFRRFL